MHQGPGSGDRGSRENCWAAVTSGGPRRPQSPRARPSTPCPPAGHRQVHPACPMSMMCPATSLAAGDGHREPLARAAWSQLGRTEDGRKGGRVAGRWGHGRAQGGREGAARPTTGPTEHVEGATGPDGRGHPLRPPLPLATCQFVRRPAALAGGPRPRSREARSEWSPPCSVSRDREAEGSAQVSPHTQLRPTGMRWSARPPEVDGTADKRVRLAQHAVGDPGGRV